ncbi:hypothetical protein FIA58_002535 [Flavobacterium jejuense]|uniref:Uncharacterized protein n=1 Tax=Flavobacterium jejuense TaxID=1544455 RepID=A0ABX0IL62_9FLAO|nr:hypothetical protein [Flavobacterium jejuense]NHN24542.1 hypothetical protein [Flavobacterium jejuense]
MITQENLHITLVEAKAFLSEDWKSKNQAFLQEEVISFFAKQLFIQLNATPNGLKLPYFKEEIQQDFAEALNQFKKVFTNENELVEPKIISQILEEIPFKELLLLMGQRITSASVQDVKAIPPLRKIILESCFQPLNKETTVVVKAWEKHVGRYPKSIFEQLKGNQREKEITIKKQIDYIIESQTWWNVFYHYKHGLVYEIRIPNGQGMRWSSDGKQFIGFLEQFL